VSAFDVFSQNKELLRSWLVNSTEGRRLLDSLLDDPTVNVLEDRVYSSAAVHKGLLERVIEETVLTREGYLAPIKTQCAVIINGDGWVEAYGPKHLRVEMVALPRHGKSARVESLAKEYAEACLSFPARAVYYPSNLIASERVCDLDVKEYHEREEKRRAEQETIKVINKFQDDLARERQGMETGSGV